MTEPVLCPADRAPVTLIGPPLAPGPLVFLGDHAGALIPQALGTLGVGEADRRRHIALDIGVGQLGRLLAEHFSTTFVSQTYSRLVVDCNRAPFSPGAMPEVSDGTAIPGNADMTDAARAARVSAIHEPYHRAIATLLDERRKAGLPTILVALHSFTPVFGAERRPWHAGVIHGGPGSDYGRRVLAGLQRVPGLVVGDNQPYAFDDTDYTIPRHAFPHALQWLEIEIRQDLLATGDQVAKVARWLASVLEDAIAG